MRLCAKFGGFIPLIQKVKDDRCEGHETDFSKNDSIRPLSQGNGTLHAPRHVLVNPEWWQTWEPPLFSCELSSCLLRMSHSVLIVDDSNKGLPATSFDKISHFPA